MIRKRTISKPKLFSKWHHTIVISNWQMTRSNITFTTDTQTNLKAKIYTKTNRKRTSIVLFP